MFVVFCPVYTPCLSEQKIGRLHTSRKELNYSVCPPLSLTSYIYKYMRHQLKNTLTFRLLQNIIYLIIRPYPDVSFSSRLVAALLVLSRRLCLHCARAKPPTPSPTTTMTMMAPVKELGKWKLMILHELSLMELWLKSPSALTTSDAFEPHIVLCFF